MLITQAHREADCGSLAAKCVYWALVSHADDDGRCWPSIDTLARECCVSRRTAQYSIRRLEGLGLVVRSASGGRHANEYTVSDIEPANRATDDANRATDDANRATDDIQPCSSCTPSNREVTEKRPEEVTPARAREADLTDREAEERRARQLAVPGNPGSPMVQSPLRSLHTCARCGRQWPTRYGNVCRGCGLQVGGKPPDPNEDPF